MKLIRSSRASTRGSVIIIALTVVSIAAIMLGSYLTLVQFQTASVARSQAWNASIAVTEAGIEEGMALINKSYPDPGADKWAWTTGTSADSWSDWTNSATSVHRDIYTNSYGKYSYTVTIRTNTGTPQIGCAGFVPFTSVPWVFGNSKLLTMLSLPMRPFVAAAGVSSSDSPTSFTAARAVQVETKLDSIFVMGLVARSNINMNGNNILVDSYNSMSNLYSSWVTNAVWGTNRVYDIKKHRDHGDVATDSALANAVDVGNANIYGKLHTGPGSATNTAQIGPNGSVGDLAFQNSGSTGFQTNAWLYDMNVSFPDVIPPSGGGSTAPPPSNVTYSNVTYNYALNSQGTLYTLNTPLSGKVVVTAANTILWAKAGISLSGGSDGIFIAPGASVKIYIGDTSGSPVSADLTGQGGINANGYAKNCQVYGLNTCTSISMSGNAVFVGTIYAPYADLTGGGGGKDKSNPKDSMGSIIVKSVSLNGHWSFHYDEALAADGPARGWIAKNWQEIKYSGGN
jgi:type II secretory pathway pseudopilin PulG